MNSVAVPVQPPRARRYRKRYGTGNLLTGIGWNALGFSYLFWGHSAWHPFEGAFWIIGGLVYIWMFSAVYWELRPEGLLEYERGSARVIPYEDIRKVTSSSCGGGAIEIRFSLLPEIFPYGKIDVDLSHRSKFLADLRKLAPAAEFRV